MTVIDRTQADLPPERSRSRHGAPLAGPRPCPDHGGECPCVARREDEGCLVFWCEAAVHHFTTQDALDGRPRRGSTCRRAPAPGRGGWAAAHDRQRRPAAIPAQPSSVKGSFVWRASSASMTKITVASPRRGEGVASVLAGDAVGEDEGGLAVDPVDDAAAQVDLAVGVTAVGDRERDAWVALDARGLPAAELRHEDDAVLLDIDQRGRTDGAPSGSRVAKWAKLRSPITSATCGGSSATGSVYAAASPLRGRPGTIPGGRRRWTDA